MVLYTLASSSKGNCALVSHNGTHILVDAGISMRRVSSCLKVLGLSLADISGIVITHEHSDHISGLPMLAKYASAQVFAPRGAARELVLRYSELAGHIRAFAAGESFRIGELEILSFPTPHDTAESVGYCICDGTRRLSFVTDLGCITDEVSGCVSGSDAVVLESNHDENMLSSGDYPYFLKRRILGERGHLSNEISSRFAVLLAESGAKCIILSHLSRENNTPELAEREAVLALERAGILAGRDLQLFVAPKDELSPCYTI